MNARDIVGATALGLSRAIRTRAVSCVEVMTAHLAQVDRLNPKVNAIVSRVAPDRLLDEASRADRRLATAIARDEAVGWMHGFPQAPKDLTSVAGLVTSQGSTIYADFVPSTDSIVVERMRAAGSIFVGRTNVPEFGLGSHTSNRLHGATGNAFDPSKSPGGSSGGAAVALALDMLPVADGSDFMGSLRNPAGWNDVFGFRPSFGRVPFGPNPETFVQQLGTEGPMARTVADLSMLLSTQAGHDARVPLSLDDDPTIFARDLDRDFAGVRVGWLGDFDGYLPMERGVLETCRRALDRFETIGCRVEAVQPAFAMGRLWDAWLVLRSFLVAGKSGALYRDPRSRALLPAQATWEIERGLALSAMQVHEASVVRTAWYRALDALFHRFDYLVLPSAQVFPFDAALDWPTQIDGRTMDTYHRWMEVVIGGTLAGLPVLCVPAGFGPGGLPIGLQVMGRPRADFAVLQVGHAYEAACGRRAMRSPLLD